MLGKHSTTELRPQIRKTNGKVLLMRSQTEMSAILLELTKRHSWLDEDKELGEIVFYSFVKSRIYRASGVTQVVECLPSKP
jgi:hypothetical protein